MRWPTTAVGSFFLLTCLAACPGSDSNNNGNTDAAAADGGSNSDGGDGAQDPDAGQVYEGDGGTGGSGGSSGSSGGWNPASDTEPAECRPDPTDFVPCGGDVKGKWRLASICFPDGLEDLRQELMCPSLTQDFDYQYRMLIDFKSSGNYSAALKSDAVQTITVPRDCLGEDADCSVLGEDDTDDNDGVVVTITSSGEDCLMEAQVHSADSAAGTWRVSGTEITMTDADGPDTSSYCVSGDVLTVRSVNEIRGTVSWGVFERE